MLFVIYNLQYDPFSCRKNIKPWPFSQHIFIVKLLDFLKDILFCKHPTLLVELLIPTDQNKNTIDYWLGVVFYKPNTMFKLDVCYKLVP